MKELEAASLEPIPEEETYAKEKLNNPRREGASLLGLPWDKENDTIAMSFPLEKAEPTKRGILSKVAEYMTHWDWHLPSHWGVNSFLP